jgi:hypothetical protein
VIFTTRASTRAGLRGTLLSEEEVVVQEQEDNREEEKQMALEASKGKAMD